MYKEKDDFSSINNLHIDQIDNYFECISSCDISDGQCISKCVEILKDYERWNYLFLERSLISIGFTLILINLLLRSIKIFTNLFTPFLFIASTTSDDLYI